MPVSAVTVICDGISRRAAIPSRARGRGWGWRRHDTQFAAARQDLLGVELEEARLVGAGGVEDEVGEAEIDIGPDLRQLLLGVGRDDPAARGPLDRQGVGEPLHLARVLDAIFSSGVRASAAQWRVSSIARFEVGVERDLDLDHPLEIAARPPRPLEALLDLRKQCLAIELIALAAGADEAVADLGRPSAAAAGPEAAIQIGTGLLRAVVYRSLLGSVILALEGDALLGPQPPDQGDRLAQPAPAAP